MKSILSLSTKISLKFRGVKTIKGVEETKKKATLKNFWNKLFGSYEMPTCPFCKEEMICQGLSINVDVAIAYPLRLPLKPSPRRIEVIFKCLQCGTFIEGQGRDLRITNGFFTLEELRVTKIFKEN